MKPRVLPVSEVVGKDFGHLAATPVPLSCTLNIENQGHESLVGLLIRTPNGEQTVYRWVIVDLTDRNGPSLRADCTLEVDGTPAQILTAPGEVLVIATPAGHWWWHWDAASKGESTAIKRSWVARGDNVQLAMDRQVMHRSSFTEQHQHLVFSQPDLASSRRPRAFEICYSTSSPESPGRSGIPEFYRIDPARDAVENPTRPVSRGQLVPVAVEDSTILLLGSSAGGGGDAELWRRALGEHWPTVRWAVLNEDFRRIIGVQLNSAGLILVCSGDKAEREGAFTVRIVNLTSDNTQHTVDFTGLRLVSDPLLINRYLFTIEDDDHGVRLVRRTWAEDTPGAISGGE